MSLADPNIGNLASRVQLKKAAILLIDPNAPSMEVLAQIFMGFGASQFLRASSYEEAVKLAKGGAIDLIVCEAKLKPDEPDGYEFVSWLRRSGLQPNCYAPVLLVTSHTSKTNIVRARDCGAHFVVMKPLAPAVLLDRILWIAQVNRSFVACDTYVGPERRFHNLGPPDGDGRRSTDLSADVGEAVLPNMDQHEVDNLVQPQKATL